MSTSKVNDLMALMERDMEEQANNPEYQAWLNETKRRHHFLDKTMKGGFTPEEEKLWAELSPEEQWDAHREISARADGYESLHALLEQEKEDKARKSGHLH